MKIHNEQKNWSFFLIIPIQKLKICTCCSSEHSYIDINFNDIFTAFFFPVLFIWLSLLYIRGISYNSYASGTIRHLFNYSSLWSWNTWWAYIEIRLPSKMRAIFRFSKYVSKKKRCYLFTIYFFEEELYIRWRHFFGNKLLRFHICDSSFVKSK